MLDQCDLGGTAALGVSSAAALDDPATYDHFFRTGYSDLRAASVLIDNVARTLGWTRIAVLGTPDNAFGQSGIKGINASVRRAAGIEIVAYEPFAVGASGADLEAAVNRSASLGRSPPADAFVEAFKARYGHTPDPWASYAYSEVVLVADALRRSRSNRTSYPTLSAALRAADVWTPAGRMQYGAGSNSPTSANLGIYQFREGDFFSIGEVVLPSHGGSHGGPYRREDQKSL